MKLSRKEINAVMDHLRNGNSETGQHITSLLSSKFASHIYSGVAFRALIYDMKDYETFQYKLVEGNSFALEKDSVTGFLESCGVDVIEYEGKKTTALIIEADIVGFNLCEFLKKEFDQFPKDCHDEIEDYLFVFREYFIHLNSNRFLFISI